MADQFKTEKFHMERTMLEFIEAEVEARIKEYPISLEVNGDLVDIDSIQYLAGEIKVVATPYKCDLEKWATEERKRIFAHPEEYTPEEHEMIFTEEEVINLHQSMRP